MKALIKDIISDWKFYGMIVLISVALCLPALIFENYFSVMVKIVRIVIFLEGAWMVCFELLATDPFPVEWYRNPIFKGLCMQAFAVFIIPRLMA